MGSSPTSNKYWSQKFKEEIDALESLSLTYGHIFYSDAKLRVEYPKLIKDMSLQAEIEVRLGLKTSEQAAKEAYALRNAILEVIREQSTQVGRAYAERIKDTVPTFESRLLNIPKNYFPVKTSTVFQRYNKIKFI